MKMSAGSESRGLNCIVCGARTALVSTLPAARIKPMLEDMFDDCIDGCPPVPDYEVWRCSGCELEFANPMASPGADFYAWLSRSGTGHPGVRWEWRASRSHLVRLADERCGSLSVLDVGCREGDYLDFLAAAGVSETIGLDLNPDVVEVAKEKGHRIYQGTLEEICENVSPQVDVVTLWHVVEHLPDPVGVIRNAQRLLTARGEILFSVPVSPMSHEMRTADPLNCPPHHLTRWTAASIHRLAAVVGMRCDIIFPRTASPLSRVTRALSLRATPAFSRKGRWHKTRRLMGYMVRHPMISAKEMRCQLARPKFGDQVLPDVMLVRFRDPVPEGQEAS